jgi:hypothetical protein
MKFNVKLQVPVRVMANLEFKLEAENEDDAYEKAFDAYKQIVKDYDDAMKLYRQGKLKSWPECPYFWHVDDDDIESNMDDRDIEVYSATPIQDVPDHVMERKPQ